MCLAVPMEVLEVDGDSALVDQAGVRTRVSLMICDEMPQVGDYVIVHAGFAIRRLDAEIARESMDYLQQLLDSVSPAGEGGLS